MFFLPQFLVLAGNGVNHMFGREKKAIYRMSERYGSRESINPIDAYRQLESPSFSLQIFLDNWHEIASVLRYPDPSKMRLEDDLLEVINLNNTGIIQAEFEDVYEVLEAIDARRKPRGASFEKAVDSKLQLDFVRDLIVYLCKHLD